MLRDDAKSVVQIHDAAKNLDPDDPRMQIGETISVLSAGFALDDLGITIRQLCLILAGVGALMTCVWLPFAVIKYRASKMNALKLSGEI